MFKLIRIYDSPTNVPEIVTISVAPGVEFKKGEAYFLDVMDGMTNVDPCDGNIYVSCDNLEPVADGERGFIRCFKIAPGMEFETKCKEELLDDIYVGRLVDIGYTDGETELCYSTMPKLIVSDIMNVQEDRIVRVKRM